MCSHNNSCILEWKVQSLCQKLNLGGLAIFRIDKVLFHFLLQIWKPWKVWIRLDPHFWIFPFFHTFNSTNQRKHSSSLFFPAEDLQGHSFEMVQHSFSQISISGDVEDSWVRYFTQCGSKHIQDFCIFIFVDFIKYNCPGP